MSEGQGTGRYAIALDAWRAEVSRAKRCRSCGASVVWTRTAMQRPIQLDVAGVSILEENRLAVATVHFVTCPDADRWRRDDPEPTEPDPEPTPRNPAHVQLDLY